MPKFSRAGAKNAFLEPILYKNDDQFTNTGSGQTYETPPQIGVFRRGENDGELVRSQKEEDRKEVDEYDGTLEEIDRQLATLQEKRRRVEDERRASVQRMEGREEGIASHRKADTKELIHMHERRHQKQRKRIEHIERVRREGDKAGRQRTESDAYTQYNQKKKRATADATATQQPSKKKKKVAKAPSASDASDASAASGASGASAAPPLNAGTQGQWTKTDNCVQRLYIFMGQHGHESDFNVRSVDKVALFVEQNFMSTRGGPLCSIALTPDDSRAIKARIGLVKFLRKAIPNHLAWRKKNGNKDVRKNPGAGAKFSPPTHLWIEQWFVDNNQRLMPQNSGFKKPWDETTSALYKKSQKNCLNEFFTQIKNTDVEKELSRLPAYEDALNPDAEHAGQAYYHPGTGGDGSVRHKVAGKMRKWMKERRADSER